MTAVWRQRFFLLQCLLGLGALWLLFLEFRTLGRIESAERTVAQRAGQARSLSMERVFAFPEDTCAPKASPVYPVQRQPYLSARDVETLSVASLARVQFQYSLVLSCCVLVGLLTGVALSYRAAARETRLARMKAGFVSNISHEMKTPLATIQMFAETLESGRVNEARMREYSAIIHRESRRLGQMIEDALDFAKMENATRQYRFAPCDLNAIVGAVCEEFRKPVEAAGGRLTVETGDLPPILADEKALGQAVTNLVSNALKYSPERKEITVRTRKSASQAVIEVEDRGIGIPANEQERIFEQFYRVNSAAAQAAKGTGLGLTIVRHIVQAHEGEVQVTSREGEGSRFTVLLPARVGRQTARMKNGRATLETAHR